MALYVYDAAYEPDLNAVKANGGIAVARYFVGNYSKWAWKRVTPAQVVAIHAAGLGVVVNFEGSSTPALTRAQGQADARAALVDIEACSIPQDGTVACYFSLDSNLSASLESGVAEYFRGIHDVMDPARIQVKAYAEGLMLDYLVSLGLVAGKQWLAAPSSWPGFNANDPNVCMFQLIGSPVGGTDQNAVHSVTDAKAIGAYWPDGSSYDPPAPGVLMALTDAQQADLYAKVVALSNAFAGGVGAGQTSVGGTIAATLGTAQGLVNQENRELAQLRALGASLDPAKFAAAVVAALPAPAATGGLTEADVETAVKAVFAKAGA